MCALNALAIYLCFAFPVAVTAPQSLPGFDHYRPVDLNQAAIERLRENDGATAQILLERAALLAPYDQAIAGNLAQLRSYREVPVPIIVRQREGQTAAREQEAANADSLPAIWAPK